MKAVAAEPSGQSKMHFGLSSMRRQQLSRLRAAQKQMKRNVKGNKWEQPIRLAGSALGHNRHVCAFFASRDEEYRVLLPFIKEGFDGGESASHIVDPKRHAEHLARLRSVGIDTTLLQQSGRLVVRDWADAHLKSGHFNQNKMLVLAETMMEASRKAGQPRNRHISHMKWALEDLPGVNDLLEYEARANYLVDRYYDLVICTYDLSKFGGNVVVDVMRTHPMVIIGGILRRLHRLRPSKTQGK